MPRNLSTEEIAAENAHDENLNNQLCGAIKAGAINTVKGLLEENNLHEYQINNALNTAAENGHLDIVTFLLQEKIPENNKNNSIASAFLSAADHNRLEIVTFLLEKHLNILSRINKTAIANSFKNAATKGHFEIVKLFLEKKLVDHNNDTETITDALISAVSNIHLEVVEHLLNNGANVNAKKGLNPILHHAIINSIPLAKILLKKSDIDVNALDNIKQTPLHLAILFENFELINALLEKQNIALDNRDYQNNTPLDLILRKHYTENLRNLVIALLQKGAHVTSTIDHLVAGTCHFEPTEQKTLAIDIIAHSATKNSEDLKKLFNWSCKNNYEDITQRIDPSYTKTRNKIILSFSIAAIAGTCAFALGLSAIPALILTGITTFLTYTLWKKQEINSLQNILRAQVSQSNTLPPANATSMTFASGTQPASDTQPASGTQPASTPNP